MTLTEGSPGVNVSDVKGAETSMHLIDHDLEAGYHEWVAAGLAAFAEYLARWAAFREWEVAHG